MNKKGFVLDIITLGVTIFILVLTILIAHKVITDWRDTSGLVADNELAANITGVGVSAVQALDNGVIFVIIALFLFAVVSSFFIRTHPVVFIAGIAALVIAIILSVTLSNIYDEVTSTAGPYNTFETDFTIIPYVMNNLPLFILLFGGLIIIAIYAKERFTQ